MGLETFKIEILDNKAADRALAFYASTGYPYRESDRIKLIECMENGDWSMVLATDKGHDIGGYYLNWAPKYSLYRRMKLPELQDLRVLQDHRRKGVATALIAKAEDMARQSGANGLGISVGLYADYGAAQRLYVRLGFMPDGMGITYDRETVQPGEKRPVDDDLALMMLKMF